MSLFVNKVLLFIVPCYNYADSVEAPTIKCCKSNCLNSIDKSESARVKLGVCAMSFKEQRSWLLTTFSTTYCKENHTFSHMICGKPVCTKAFIAVTGICKSRYYEIRSSFQQGHFQVITLNQISHWARIGNAMALPVCI